MDLTTVTDQALQELIKGNSQVEFDFLAAKILLTKLRARARIDSSPTVLVQSVAELRKLLNRFQDRSAVQSDIQRIAGSLGALTNGQVLFTRDEVASKIAQGRSLVLAGDHALLKELPGRHLDRRNDPLFHGDPGGSLHQRENLRD